MPKDPSGEHNSTPQRAKFSNSAGVNLPMKDADKGVALLRIRVAEDHIDKGRKEGS